MPPSLTTEAKHTPWSVSLPKYPNQYLVRLFDAQDRLVASSSWHDSSPYYPTKAQSIDNFERIAAAINERPSLLSLIEDMATELSRSSEHLKCFSDYHPEESTCDIAASLHCSRDLLSRYTEFMEKHNG